jgi:anti-sigma regulatory factor (Ser/Thr protein kinase)
VLLLSEHDGDPLSLPLTDGSLLNVIARVSKNGELNISDVSVTVKKLLGSDIFGVEKYVRWGSTISNFQIGTSNDLPTVQRHLEELLTDLKVENRKMNEILTIAEELILNALLNAPVDAQGNRIYANKPREEEVALPPEHASLLSFAADGDRVAIACRDPFGSLDPDNLLRSLRRCADIESNGVRTDGQGGAGIGLFIVYRFADHMVVNLSPGHATEFIAVVDLSLKGRDRSETARSLNMFISSEGHGPLVA